MMNSRIALLKRVAVSTAEPSRPGKLQPHGADELAATQSASWPRNRWMGAIWALGLIALVLATASTFVDSHNFYVNGLHGTLNDQVGYVSVARNLVEKGTLESDLIYPSVLAQPTRRNSLYVPGHYWVLGAMYKYLGFSVAHTFLPSLIGFAIAGVLIYLIAFERCGRRPAYYSGALFVLFPLNLIYSFTAMAEMTLMAAVLLAFAIFLWIPARARPWIGPVLLALPFLFRETGIAVGVVMGAVIWNARQCKWKHALLFCALACLVVVLLLNSPIAKGRPSLWAANILYQGSYSEVYTDALAVERLHPGPRDWTLAILRKMKGNLHTLLLPDLASRDRPLEVASLLFILAGIPIGLFLWWREQLDMGLGAAAMIALLLGLDVCFYTVWEFRGVKSLLICEPFAAMMWGIGIERVLRFGRANRFLTEIPVILAAVLGLLTMQHVFKGETIVNRATASDTAWLESLGIEPGRLLVSPFWLSLDYVQKHHPQQWAFIPSNRETLRLLDERYPIGTLVLPVAGKTPVPEKLRARDAMAIGLVPTDEVFYRGIDFRIFRRPKHLVSSAKRNLSWRQSRTAD